MKNKIAIIVMLSILCGLIIVGCQKDEALTLRVLSATDGDDTETTARAKPVVVNNVGLQLRWFYTKTVVLYDRVDTMQRKQTAYNHAKLDSVRLIKDGAQIYDDTIRAPYQATFYCGSNIYNERVYAPDRVALKGDP